MDKLNKDEANGAWRAVIDTAMILRKPDGSEEVISAREATRRGFFNNVVSVERVKAT